MDRCHFGDRLHAVHYAASYGIQWLLRMIAGEGVTGNVLASAEFALMHPAGRVTELAEGTALVVDAGITHSINRGCHLK